MRSLRALETSVLGYRVERLEEFDDTGLLRSVRYEVLCPHTGAVLGNHATLRAARRHVIVHELRAVRSDRQAQRTMLIA